MFDKLIAKIARALKKFKIDYMIIGGQAVLVHGEPRLTRDIDIILAIDTSKLPEIIAITNNLRLKILVTNPAEFVKKTMVLPVIEVRTGIRVDLIFSTSEYEKIAISRAVLKKLGKVFAKFISAEDLIIHKIIAGRPRDIEDIKSILLKNSDYDHDYIVKWLMKFDKALDISLLNTFKKIIKDIK